MATLELRLDRTTFFGAVYKTQGVVDKKSTSSVLSNVVVQSLPNGRCRLSGTDYDVSIFAEIPAEVVVEGVACINGNKLFETIKHSEDGVLHLKAQPNDWSELKVGRSHFKLAGIAPTDYPDVKFPSDVRWLGVPKAALKDLVEKTSFSMSADETRMSLNGVLFKMGPGSSEGLTNLTMVSTDGHRLSKAEVELEVSGMGAGESFSSIIHKKGVSELKRLFDTDADLIEVGFTSGQILFRTESASGSTTFLVRQIEDGYPDYKRVIPASSPIHITVPRERLMRSLRKVASFSPSKANIIKIELSTDKLAVTASNPDSGEGRDELDVEYRENGMVIGFNYTYLNDVLNVVKGEHIVFNLNNEYSPTVLTCPAEPGAVFVVMPMRV